MTPSKMTPGKRASRVPAGCLGALVGGAAFFFGATDLTNNFVLGMGLGFWFGVPLGGLLFTAVATAWANHRRPPGAPAASARGLLVAVGAVLLLLGVVLFQLARGTRETVRLRTADRQFQLRRGTGPDAPLDTWLHSPRGDGWEELLDPGHTMVFYREEGAAVVGGQPGTLVRQRGPPGGEVFIPNPGARSPHLRRRSRPGDPWLDAGQMWNHVRPYTGPP